ncbi:MAG TPA: cell division protein FtsL [Thiotrichales bacterium]|nr:cell division protein FtsL [Thiotrichales bacterium]
MRMAVLGLLLLAVLGSAIAVVYAKHRSRTLFIELQELRAERDRLDIEWGQLQLEQSTWANHGRIERLARERLGMSIPEHEDIVIVEP